VSEQRDWNEQLEEAERKLGAWSKRLEELQRQQQQMRKDYEEEVRQQHQLVFDACKHFTTLDTALALILLAVLRELGVELSAAIWPLAAFGFSLIACVYGMLATAMGGLGVLRHAISASNALFIGIACFLVGLFYSVIYILSAAS
jgi:hypothetical protein